MIELMLFMGMVAAASVSAVSDKDYLMMPPLFHLDDFDRCLMLHEEMLYCSVTVQLKPANQSRVWDVITEVINNPKNYRHDRLRYGICVPTYCPNITRDLYSPTNDDESLRNALSECFSEKFREVGLTGIVTKSHCENNRPFYGVDVYDLLITTFFGAVLLLVGFASFYEGSARYKSEEEYNRIVNTKFGNLVSCFSIPKNWYRLSNVNETPDAKSLRCIQGLRFGTMFAVVMSHTCMIAFSNPVSNPQYLEKATEELLKMLLLNGGLVVQTFFLISGFLLCFQFFVALENRKKLTVQDIFLAIFHRYIRLTPSLFVVAMFNSSWLYRVSRGPNWDHAIGDEYRNCRANWWTNVLYINNYYNKENMCLQQTWYIAADTQMFLVSLLIVALMWNFRRHITIILASSLAIAITIPAVINWVNDYDILIRSYPEPLYTILLDNQHWHQMFASGYTNGSGYIVGLAFGYYFYLHRGQRSFENKNKFCIAIWWIFMYGCPVSVVLSAAAMYSDDFTYTKLGSALYIALGRPIFAFGVGLAIFGLSQGAGWFMRWFLCWKPLQPLGRITYSAFLVHVIPMRIRAGQIRTVLFVSDYLFFSQTLGDVVMAYSLGLVLCLFIEMPTSALMKLALKPPPKPELKSRENGGFEDCDESSKV